ncbi:MAG TPA: S8 family peptidase [Verrucomicrobiae bacterium]|nr:S8 family peptidase [Verrucomicrobiae bacterium]
MNRSIRFIIKPRLGPTRLELFLLLFLALMRLKSPAAVTSTNSSAAPLPTPTRILVKPKSGLSLVTLHQNTKVQVLAQFPGMGGLEIIQPQSGTTPEGLLAIYRQSELVEYAELDRVVHAMLDPNDTHFQNGNAWHVNNYGQSGGIAGADIKAREAWDIRTDASSVIVAVLDSGARFAHQDLTSNLWRNPGEISGNGLDDDGNGYIDDVHGINAIVNNGNPSDDYGHGSHVAGIVGAVGNNNAGVVGVCWQVQLMICKFIDSAGNGWVSDAIKSIDYARSKGAKVINLSWGEPEYNSQALYDAIASARDAGIIVVCACGNESLNNDVTPLYPASFSLNNILSVAATTRRDELASFSCYGPSTVDLGAPGDTIASCSSDSNTSYQYRSGTSMAAPMVAGACALVWAQFPSDNYSQIINRILDNVDPLPELAGKCLTGGRLNLNKALTSAPPAPPATLTVVASDDIATLGTTDTAAFTFTRNGDNSADLTADFEFSGTAVKWTDYRRPEGDMPEVLTIPAGQNSATLTFLAIANTTGANPQTVIVTLRPSSAYVVGSPGSASATILPAMTPFPVSISFVPPSSISLRWPSSAGATYRVLGRPDLTSGTWQNQSSVINATGDNTTWNASTSPGRFYFRVLRLN